jgi:hypothetical protein
MEISEIEFPDEVQAKIHELALDLDVSDDEVVTLLVRVFFAMVEDKKKEDVPALVKKVREALRRNASSVQN